jgi:hypothetical protein
MPLLAQALFSLGFNLIALSQVLVAGKALFWSLTIQKFSLMLFILADILTPFDSIAAIRGT